MKIMKVALFNFVIIAIVIIMAEAALRWHYFALPLGANHLAHPYLQNILKPGLDISEAEKLDELDLRTTGERHAGDNIYNIIALGDSCTFSVASSSWKTSYPFILEKALNRSSEKDVYEVFNAGVSGYNSLQMLLKLHFLMKVVKPHEVIIYGGWNDFRVLLHDRGELYIENNSLGIPMIYRHRQYWELHNRIKSPVDRLLSRSFLYDHIRFKLVAHYKRKEIVSLWKQKGLYYMPDNPLIIDTVFENFRNNIESIICLSQGKGARIGLTTLASPLSYDMTNESQDEFLNRFGAIGNFLRLTPAEQLYYRMRFNTIIRELADRYHADLYDWDKWYEETRDPEMFSDILHPTDAGYEFMVSKIMERRALSGRQNE